MCLQCGRPGFDAWVGKIPWRRKRQPAVVFSPRESHGQRSLEGPTVLCACWYTCYHLPVISASHLIYLWTVMFQLELCVSWFLVYIYFVGCVFQLPTRRVRAWLFFAKWDRRMPKPLNVWITTNCGKFLKGWEYQTTWPASWEICMQVKKQQWELDMEQQTDSK